jgi:uncharacterized protein (TIGR01440 family)
MTDTVYGETLQVLEDLLNQFPLGKEHILVVGASTSEVRGYKIGTQGSEAIAQAIFEAVDEMQRAWGFHVAYQCCEHLNRALVVRRSTAEAFGLEEVTVVPVPEAGGAMAAYAFHHWPDAIVVEQIKAHAGLDIGGTLIGMHLKPVAVPIRSRLRQIGAAPITLAKTRPKLIGGARAVYEKK